jgi:hypothetical protein
MAIRELVLWDPSGIYWEGALVDAGANAEALRRRGVALLPVDTVLLRAGAMGGYVKRAWGSGWRLTEVPSHHCQMAMLLQHERTRLHWVARLVPHELEKGQKPRGWLRLLGDASQPPVSAAPVFPAERADRTDMTTVSFDTIGEPDESGGWTVSGEAGCGLINAGFFAFALHGAGRGVAIAWAAVSQTS